MSITTHEIKDFMIRDTNETSLVHDGVSSKHLLQLLLDENELTDVEKDMMCDIKDTLINKELVNLSDEDVLSDIRLLMDNVPRSVTPLEKVRWYYINLGKLFSYDYRVAYDIYKYGYDKQIDMSKFVGRYQTCIQISEILNMILNTINGVECKTIKRKLRNERGMYGDGHIANEVIINQDGNTLKLLLDLTLDLYLIQSDCLTKHFGYEDDGSGTYDIISQSENKAMDLTLGFIFDENDYTNSVINKFKERIRQTSFDGVPPKEIVNYKIAVIHKLSKKFPGYHEGKRYIEMLFDELLDAYFKEFNLYYQDEDQVNLKTVYRINLDDYEKWIIYSNKSGFICTNIDKLRDMLDNGWMTNSETLKDIVYSNYRK